MIDTNTDSRLKYNSGFPTGNLNFKHALEIKITVNLIKGEGFSSDFTSKSVVLNGFYKMGLDVLGGSFNVVKAELSVI